MEPSARRPVVSDHRRAEIRALAMRSNQVVLFAALTGALTGLIVSAFEFAVVDVALDRASAQALPVMAVLPLVGLVVSWSLRRTVGGGIGPGTADEYLKGFHAAETRSGHERWWPVSLLPWPPSARARRWSRGPVDLRGRHHRRRGATTSEALVPRCRSPHADGGRRGCRCGGDLQGACDRRRVRARGAVPGRPRPPDVAAVAGRRGQRLPGVRLVLRYHAALPARRVGRLRDP
ncbi:MAG: hypothetical protein R2713_18010 [Ilumatobacteraceae bacterium]